MKKSIKEQLVAHYSLCMRSYNSLFIVSNKNFSAQYLSNLKRLAKRRQDKCFLVKNTLMKRAVDFSIAQKKLADSLDGSSILFCSNEPVSAIKFLHSLGKEAVPSAGIVSQSFVNAAEISCISKFLPEKQIRSKIVFSLKNTASKIVFLSKQSSAKIVRIIKSNNINKK